MNEPLKEIRDRLAGEVAYWETIFSSERLRTPARKAQAGRCYDESVARLRAFDELTQEKVLG